MTQQTIESVSVSISVNPREVATKVDRAVELNRLIDESSKELDQLKAQLRELAATGAFPTNERGTVELRSEETGNCAQVCPVKDTPVIIKGVDVAAVKGVLTAGQFGLMFKETIGLNGVEQFEDAFKALPKKLQGAVKKFVTWRSNAAQVKLSK